MVAVDLKEVTEPSGRVEATVITDTTDLMVWTIVVRSVAVAVLVTVLAGAADVTVTVLPPLGPLAVVEPSLDAGAARPRYPLQ